MDDILVPLPAGSNQFKDEARSDMRTRGTFWACAVFIAVTYDSCIYGIGRCDTEVLYAEFSKAALNVTVIASMAGSNVHALIELAH